MATKFNVDQIVSICAYTMCSADGNISDEEIISLSQNKFFSTYHKEEYVRIFEGLIAEEKLIDTLKDGCKILESESEDFKIDLIDSLTELLLADGEIEENELTILNIVSESIGFNSGKLTDLLNTYTQRTVDKFTYSLEESVTICSLIMAGIDGHLSESEIQMIKNDNFFQKYFQNTAVDMYAKITAVEKRVEVIEKFTLLKEQDDEFKRSLIFSLLDLSASDGNIDDYEKGLIVAISNAAGITEDELSKILNSWVEKVRSQIAAKKSTQSNSTDSSCFVVTATYGDVNHPVVNDFRLYRDSVLMKYLLGRVFINFYYIIGPFFASIIKSHSNLRKLARLYLIQPIHSILFKDH